MGEITIPADIVPNTKQDVILDNTELSKGFDALVSDKKNPIFLSMLGYIFYRAVPRKDRTKKMDDIKPKLSQLLQYDNEDFKKLREREEGLIDLITEGEINKFFTHYLEEIEKTDMLNLIQALSTNEYFPEKTKQNKDGTVTITITEPLNLNAKKLQNFKLTQIDNQSAIERLVDNIERGQEIDSDVEIGPKRESGSGALMSAIDSGKPILYEMIKNYFVVEEQVSGAKITLDTKKYVNEVFIKEGFGAFDSENFPFKSGILGSKLEHFDKPNQQKDESEEQYEARMFFEGKKKKTFSEKDTRNNIPLLHLKLVGDKGAGKYEKEKDMFLVEGLTGSKKFDTLEDAYDAIDEISTKPKLVEKYLEKIIMSQDKHPLKNIIYGYLSAERRELKLGTLEIEINKTKEGSSKDKQKWVESIRSKLNLDEGIDVKLDKNVEKLAGMIFEVMQQFPKMDNTLLESLIDNEVKREKHGFRIIEEEVSDKEQIEEDKETWDSIVANYRLFSDKLDISLVDILDEYRNIENVGELDIDAVRIYAKDLMSKSKSKSGFIAGKSRIPILYADVTYDMDMLLDTTPKNYKFKIKPQTKNKEPTSMDMDVVRVQKDFLNIKRGYNSLKALVGGN